MRFYLRWLKVQQDNDPSFSFLNNSNKIGKNSEWKKNIEIKMNFFKPPQKNTQNFFPKFILVGIINELSIFKNKICFSTKKKIFYK